MKIVEIRVHITQNTNANAGALGSNGVWLCPIVKKFGTALKQNLTES